MTLKEKLKKKKVTIGSWITIGHGSVAEIMAKAGFDWLTVDMEHSPITSDQCQDLIRIIDLCGISPLVRVGANDPLLIKQAMDSGAHGVIVPMVNTKEDAKKAVRAVQYPSSGARGVGLARAQGYGASFQKYKQWLRKESIVVVQIEHIEAVDHLEEILAVDGVDAFIVGPYDLSGSLGIPGNFKDKRMIQVMKKIKRVASQSNVSSGFHVVSSDGKLVQQKIREGYTFVAFGIDFLFFGENCRSELKNVRNKIK